MKFTLFRKNCLIGSKNEIFMEFIAKSHTTTNIQPEVYFIQSITNVQRQSINPTIITEPYHKKKFLYKCIIGYLKS